MQRTVIAMFALLAVVACVTAEAPALRFRPRFVAQRSNARFARLEEAPAAPSPAEEPSSGETPSTGYQYPKPTSSGYQYPKPDQAFPLPGEDGPTEVGPETTTAGTEATATASVAPEDYEDSTGAAEDSTNGVNPTAAPTDVPAKDAQRKRLQQQVNRQPIRLTLAQRLEETEADREPTVVNRQQPVRPVYLINLPESALQQLILLSNPQPTLQLAPVPQLAPTTVLLSELDYVYTKK